jgi:hypothetical protein
MARHQDPEALSPCPWCGSARLIDFGSDMVCPECGTVLPADRSAPEFQRSDRRS